MKNKILLTFLAAFLCALTVKAQAPTNKQTVIVDAFTAEADVLNFYNSLVNDIREKIMVEMHETQRVEVVNVLTDPFFNTLDGIQTQAHVHESVLKNAEIRKIVAEEFNTKFAITTHVSNMRAVRSVTAEGMVYFTGEISITMDVVDLTNGQIVHTKNFSYSGLTGQTGNNEITSINNTANYLYAALPKFIDTAFPVTGEILDIISSKKNAATKVYFSIGSSSGVEVKDRFDVFEVKRIAGREMRNQLGYLTVLEVGGEEISICKVSKSCGEAIFQAVQNPGKTNIVIVSHPKNNISGAIGGFAKGLVH